jgi:hypothetical protein
MKKAQVPRGRIPNATALTNRKKVIVDAVKTALQAEPRKAREQLAKKHIYLEDLIKGNIPLRQIIMLEYNLKEAGFKAIDIANIVVEQFKITDKKKLTLYLFKCGFKEPTELSDAAHVIKAKIPEIRDGIKNLDYNPESVAKGLFQRGLSEPQVIQELENVGFKKLEQQTRALILNGVGSNVTVKLMTQKHSVKDTQVRNLITRIKSSVKQVAVPVRS